MLNIVSKYPIRHVKGRHNEWNIWFYKHGINKSVASRKKMMEGRNRKALIMPSPGGQLCSSQIGHPLGIYIMIPSLTPHVFHPRELGKAHGCTTGSYMNHSYRQEWLASIPSDRASALLVPRHLLSVELQVKFKSGPVTLLSEKAGTCVCVCDTERENILTLHNPGFI